MSPARQSPTPATGSWSTRWGGARGRSRKPWATKNKIKTTGFGGPGAAGSTLNTMVQNNEVNISGFGSAGARVTWSGPLTATFDQNEFTGTAGSNDGISINATSSNALASVAVTNNIFATNGGNDTGV